MVRKKVQTAKCLLIPPAVYIAVCCISSTRQWLSWDFYDNHDWSLEALLIPRQFDVDKSCNLGSAALVARLNCHASCFLTNVSKFKWPSQKWRDHKCRKDAPCVVLNRTCPRRVIRSVLLSSRRTPLLSTGFLLDTCDWSLPLDTWWCVWQRVLQRYRP